MNNLVARLHSIANHPLLPIDACIDIHEAAVWLTRLSRDTRTLKAEIERLKQKVTELEEQHVF